MINGQIKTNLDSISTTIMFHSIDTPSNAYEKLTDAVYRAHGYPDLVQIDIDSLPNGTVLGTATYDPDAEKVVELTLNKEIRSQYGTEK
jgi:hypothetical protein